MTSLLAPLQQLRGDDPAPVLGALRPVHGAGDHARQPTAGRGAHPRHQLRDEGAA